MMHKHIYIVTGGPGFGKTALVNELQSHQYLCSGEFARDLIEEQQQSGGDLLPWKRPKEFQQAVLQLRKAFFESVPEATIAFADRGIPDQIAFARYRGFETPPVLKHAACEYRYANQVFLTPPWPEIYQKDTIREETLEEAILIHQSIIATYTELDYEIVELPLAGVKERMNYLLQIIQNKLPYEF